MKDLGEHAGTWVTSHAGGQAEIHVRHCAFEVVAGPNAGRKETFAQEVIRLGARAGADFKIDDPKVSGVHCEVRLEKKGFRLRDLSSTNGTVIGGMRIVDVYVPPGAIIEIGDSKVRFDTLKSSEKVELLQAEKFGHLYGQSPVMRHVFARLAKIAATDATVMVTGETGTGKDVVAESLHEQSPRGNGPFVVLDCGAIAANLIESEIFGHEKGAFTGATQSHAGAFERAHKGTVFLDEIGELPLDLQPKLLRVLEKKEIRRVGGQKTEAVDVRLIAATNRDLAKEVNQGRFREDLYYRLAVAEVRLPPLRERIEDIPLLVEHFLKMTPGGDRTVIGGESIKLMQKHSWPGNVRELRNVVERAVLLSELPTEGGLRRRSPGASESDESDDASSGSLTMRHAIDLTVPFKQAKQDLVDEFEKRYIEGLLDYHGHNMSAAARAAGVDRMTIHKIVERLGLKRPPRG